MLYALIQACTANTEHRNEVNKRFFYTYFRVASIQK